jgi:tRNA pseudouridine38-40 synthase
LDGDRIVIEVEADGFLYNMVRNIVGTLVEVGKGNQSVDWPSAVLAGRDRTVAGMCAPAHGLYLLKVYYSE